MAGKDNQFRKSRRWNLLTTAGRLTGKSLDSFLHGLKGVLMAEKIDRHIPITYREAQSMTGLPLGTLYSLVYRKQIPHLRLGKRSVRFVAAELELWMRPQIKTISSSNAEVV